MPIRQNPGQRVVSIVFGRGDVVVSPIADPGVPTQQVGVALYQFDGLVEVGSKLGDAVEAGELKTFDHPRVEFHLDTIAACRGALVLSDALRNAAESVATALNEERKSGKQAFGLAVAE